MAWAESGTGHPLRKHVGYEDPTTTTQCQGRTRPGRAKLDPTEQLPRTGLIGPGEDNREWPPMKVTAGSAQEE